MSLTLSEQEIVIRVALDETEITATGTGGPWVRYLQTLVARVGGTGTQLSPKVYRAVLPRDQVNLLVPKKRTVLSDEEKVRRRALLSKVRASRQSTALESTQGGAE
jgi:hypothetical protein